ncbi:hypothetical protein [Amycolatopsis methanolica]|uniref:hypothetical protein n=1 Tax=Amycolatopsis methanolica TaxID=1814 RepID=UPI00341665EE
MESRWADADYRLRWPRDLFVQAAARLLNDRGRTGWEDECELLLEDAFAGGHNSGPLSDFREVKPDSDPWGQALAPKARFLRDLMQNADKLREGEAERRPYWSQRKTGLRRSEPAALAATAHRFVFLVNELDDRGYFEKYFEKDCVDAPREVDPSELIEEALGVPDLWPLNAAKLGEDLDLFCDVIEVLHDFVARPTARSWHSFSGCGWHHSHFSFPEGRKIYTWRVNQLLQRSVLNLRLAGDGEDAGRMVTTAPDEREQLVEAMVARDDGEIGDQIRHAIALFRNRGADKHAKRSAVVALANILEERRGLLSVQLLSKDEGALFEIANKFNIRHQTVRQHSDYDPAFLDWIFWWYLATIELTDRLLTRNA